VWLELLRKKDAYVLLILLGALVAWLFSVDTFGLNSAARYLADAGLLLAWVFSMVLAITLGARQIPKEEERGTVFSLLSKPLSRGELLAGKWLGVWSAAAASSMSFYAVVIAATAARGRVPDWVPLLQAWVLHAASLAVVAAAAVALSTRMSYGAAAAMAFVLIAVDYMLLPRVPAFVADAGGARATAMMVVYYLLPHLEVFDMRRRVVHDWGPAPWGAVIEAVVYAAVVAAAIMLLAWAAYRRKRFSRGAQ